ncbi:MAG: AraC family transcriptional regulator [Saprospiraceae bacterium]|nr:AraC family transcriptional regulator [Saprospiraceae bacterium]
METITAVRLMDAFPDFTATGFDVNYYNSRFVKANYLIHAWSKEISFPEHWGALSIKMAFGGKEFYEDGYCVYAVDDANYLVFNEGKLYSSYIQSDEAVESLTISFSPEFESEATRIWQARHKDLLDEPFFFRANKFYFAEQLYAHNQCVTPIAIKIKSLSRNIWRNQLQISELYCQLYEAMLDTQQDIVIRIQNLQAEKKSTRTELYRRLNNARDFIYSCYAKPLTLDEIAQVACLSPIYFLREFKKMFGVPPYKYLQQRRIQEAKRLLETSSLSISNICALVGYDDLSSFGKLFKKYYLQSPEQFRLTKKSIFT